MGRYVPNKVIRDGALCTVTLVKHADAARNKPDIVADRINRVIQNSPRYAWGPYFAVRYNRRWHLYRATPGVPRIIHKEIPAAAVEMYLLHKAAMS